MSVTAFNALPSDARVWVFASDRELTDAESDTLLREVDEFLNQWKAHGAPLRAARDWRDRRFLAIGVDPTAEQASGCSIDGLFRGLRVLEQTLGTRLVAGGRVFYRDTNGTVQQAARNDVRSLAERGAIDPTTRIFDTSVTSARGWREHFERPVRESWVEALLGDQLSQSSSRSATKVSSARSG